MQRQKCQEGSAQVFDRRPEEQDPLLEEQQLEEDESSLLELLDERTGRKSDVQLLAVQHVGRQAGVQVLVGLVNKNWSWKCIHESFKMKVSLLDYIKGSI